MLHVRWADYVGNINRCGYMVLRLVPALAAKLMGGSTFKAILLKRVEINDI